MEIVQYILNFFFPGDDCNWIWNWIFLVLLVSAIKYTTGDKQINIK